MKESIKTSAIDSTSPRRVCLVTSTRADWGLLRPIAEGLRARDDVELSIIATNMHLMQRFGHTVDEILADGFDVAATVDMDLHDDKDSELSRALAMSRCMNGMAQVFDSLQPHLLVLLGDRYEILATACAAAVMRIPVAHIAGGEVSLGAVDDRMRHAITKLSSLHLTATAEYQQRVIRMGENPNRVINTGAIGVWNTFNTPLMSVQEICDSLGGFELTPHRVILATFHPATLDDADPAERCRCMLQALDSFPEYKVVITYPNNDARSSGIIDAIENYGKANPHRVLVVKSLGARRYLSMLAVAAVVVGNSSSAIVEVPSAGIPSVDIGIRQKGRLAAPSVIRCGDSADNIRQAIETALSADFQRLASLRQNPYFKPDSRDIIVEAIASTPLSLLRDSVFYDGPLLCVNE